MGHGVLRRRARPGDVGREPRSPAPAGDAGRLLDVLEAGPGRVRRVRRGPRRGCGEALYAPLEARAGGGGLQALRYADHGQGRHPAFVTVAVASAPAACRVRVWRPRLAREPST